MRLALGAGGLAALSALAAAIVLPPRPATQTMIVVQQAAVVPTTSPGLGQVRRPVQYVQLAPGETAPPGATVIDGSAPTPVTVVVPVPTPAPQAPAQKPVIIKTTQSGKVIP